MLLGLAVAPGNPASAQNQAQQTAAERCSEHHEFGARPVDVAKTADGQTVLAQVSWGYHNSIGCYLVLDQQALAILRAAPPSKSLPNAPTEASDECFGHHKFGKSPVDVAKTNDGRTVLARLSWGYHDAIGCYLVLDDTALATLRVAQTDTTGDGTSGDGTSDTDTPRASPEFTILTTSGDYSCAIKTDQTIACWGNNRFGQTDAPPGQYTTLASGGVYSCAIKTDQTIACWGDNGSGQIDAPPGQYTNITANTRHSCAIKTDQTIACWGDNGSGQIDAPPGQYTNITANTRHSCAIKTDQTIACWGDNGSGQIDAPPGQYTNIATGRHHSCAIKTNGTITCWGNNQFGQTDAPPGQYTNITADDSYSCAIRTDRSIACWGGRWGGRPDAPPGQYSTLATSELHSCAIRTDQTIACWGSNQFGQTDAPPGQYIAIATAIDHSCAIRTNHTVNCWGDDSWGQSSVPLRLRKPPEDIVDVMLALDSDPVASTNQSFEVVIGFTHAVSGFDPGDITVVNGDVTSFLGSGSQYRATIEATLPGNVVMWIGRHAVQDQRGNGNDEPSQPLVVSFAKTPPITMDTWDREAVMVDFAAEFDRQEPDPGWTGDLSDCIAGTTSQEYRDSVFQRINWYRKMAGVLPIVEAPELSMTAQSKALILAAEGRVAHSFGPDWACATRIPRRHFAESVANLSGIDSIDGYMWDPGSNNLPVGHRRMVISRNLVMFGTGDIPGRSNVLQANRGGDGQIREQRGFVAWPSPGYTPYTAVWGRWSFTLPDADFSNATVTVVDDNGPVELRIISRRELIEPGIVWAMAGDTNSAQHARPLDGDHCYAVTISGVEIDGETQPPYEYATCVIDPQE